MNGAEGTAPAGQAQGYPVAQIPLDELETTLAAEVAAVRAKLSKLAEFHKLKAFCEHSNLSLPGVRSFQKADPASDREMRWSVFERLRHALNNYDPGFPLN